MALDALACSPDADVPPQVPLFGAMESCVLDSICERLEPTAYIENTVVSPRTLVLLLVLTCNEDIRVDTHLLQRLEAPFAHMHISWAARGADVFLSLGPNLETLRLSLSVPGPGCACLAPDRAPGRARGAHVLPDPGHLAFRAPPQQRVQQVTSPHRTWNRSPNTDESTQSLDCLGFRV